MKNKIRLIIAATIAAAIFFAIKEWRVFHDASQTKSSATDIHAPATAESHQKPTTNTAPIPSAIVQTTNTDAYILGLSMRDFYAQTRIDHQLEWKMPINFYGRVVDENEQPVGSASIHFTWNDISVKGTSDADVKSDGNGFFSLTDRRGKGMSVTVSKDGYYTYPSERLRSFEYAQPDIRFQPDPNNPIVFHLRRKGVGVDLVTSKHGIALPGLRSYLGVSAPLNGNPVAVDLSSQTISPNGQLIISQIKPEYANWQQATQWSFKMEIPNGGFIEDNDEFPFAAPEDGYQKTIEFDLDKNQPDWKTSIHKDFYIKYGNPPQYGHLYLDTSIMMEGARLTYAINPTGSRNLEPK
jgi:hypothetical protein